MDDNYKVLLEKITKENRHCLISGVAGTGKSTLLKKTVKELKKIVDKETIHITAPTGIACINIGNAKTIHNWLGLKLADKPMAYYREHIYTNPNYATTIHNLLNTAILIIDEISMITPYMFMLIDHLARFIRKNREPFGGILLFMFGDFCQLEPITKEETEIKYVFQTDLWKSMNIYRHRLRKIHRQLNDDAYKDLLNRIREGKITLADEKLLRSKRFRGNMEFKLELDEYNNVKITSPLLTTHRVRVSDYNRDCLKNVSKTYNTPLIALRPKITTKYCKNVQIDLIQKTRYSEDQLKAMFPVYNVLICEKAQVMMRCNEYLKTHNICNGTLGIVDRITPSNEVFVRFRVNDVLMPPMLVPPHKYKLKINGGYVVLEQFPLSLAYAISIHMCQGITLDSAIVDIARVFADGMAYVALSRVKSLDGLTIKGNFDTRKFKSNPDALEFERDTEFIDTKLELEKYMIRDLSNIVLKYLFNI